MKKKTEGDVGVGNSRRPVNVAGERNALSQRIASRASGVGVATEAGDGPGKRANDTNELSAIFGKATVFRVK